MSIKRWRKVPSQILVWLVAAVFIFTGKFLAPLTVPIGMLTGWPRFTWAWDNSKNHGLYADGHWYERYHWSWKVHPKFAEFWWRAIRNGFSNGARYALKNTNPDDLWQHPNYHQGHYKGPAWRAFPHDFAPFPKTLFRYEYDLRRPWLARYVFTWFMTKTRYFQFYAGFKFDRTEGFGISFRCWIYANEK